VRAKDCGPWRSAGGGCLAGSHCDGWRCDATFTSDDLLAWHDAATLAVPHDPAYGRAMSYRALL